MVVGATAPTEQDLHPTPTSGNQLMAGAEIQANAIWTALHGFPLREVPGWLNVLLVVALALAPPLLSLRLGAAAVGLTSLALGAAWLVGAQLAFDAGHVVAVVAPLAALLVAAAGALIAIHLAERNNRRRLERESAVLEGLVRERTAELREAQFEIVRRLAQAAESRDEETGQHIDRISRMCGQLARAAGLQRRGGRADRRGLGAPRRRQDRHTRRRAAQAGQAQPRGVGRHAPAPGDRRRACSRTRPRR